MNPHLTDNDTGVRRNEVKCPRPSSKYRKSSFTIPWVWSLEMLADEVRMDESQPHGWERARG